MHTANTVHTYDAPFLCRLAAETWTSAPTRWPSSAYVLSNTPAPHTHKAHVPPFTHSQLGTNKRAKAKREEIKDIYAAQRAKAAKAGGEAAATA